MSELKPCPFCGENPISHNQLVACVYFACSVNPSIKLLNYEESKHEWNQRSETETEKRLTADIKIAISLMSPSWQHAASKEPDLMTRYVTMAENQFKKKNEEIERLTAIATKHATRADEIYEALEILLSKQYKYRPHNKAAGIEHYLISCHDLNEARKVLDRSRIEAEKGDGI